MLITFCLFNKIHKMQSHLDNLKFKKKNTFFFINKHSFTDIYHYLIISLITNQKI